MYSYQLYGKIRLHSKLLYSPSDLHAQSILIIPGALSVKD